MEVTPLEFFKAVYMNDELPLSIRLKAASEAAQYVHPKLSVTAQVGADFASAMESAFRRSAAVLQPPKMIDARKVSGL